MMDAFVPLMLAIMLKVGFNQTELAVADPP